MTSLTDAGPPHLCSSSSSAAQQAASTEKNGSGAPNPDFFGSADPWWEQQLAAKAQLEEVCPTEPLVLLCWCLWGPALPSLLHATWSPSPASSPKRVSLCDSDSPHVVFLLLGELILSPGLELRSPVEHCKIRLWRDTSWNTAAVFSLALALLVAVVKLGARCYCVSQLLKKVQVSSCIFKVVLHGLLLVWISGLWKHVCTGGQRSAVL